MLSPHRGRSLGRVRPGTGRSARPLPVDPTEAEEAPDDEEAGTDDTSADEAVPFEGGTWEFNEPHTCDPDETDRQNEQGWVRWEQEDGEFDMALRCP